MNKETQHAASKPGSNFRRALAHPLIRLLAAGLVASMITFTLLLFMRFLVAGFDKSTSAAITRYFSLQTVISHRAADDSIKRIERPGQRPEFSGIDKADFEQDAEAFMLEQAEDAPPVISPTNQGIESDVKLPQLEAPQLSDQEKLQRIKQEILAGEN